MKSRFEYTIILRNVSTAASLYGKDVTLTDVIPDGMEFVEVTDTMAFMGSVNGDPPGSPIVICRKQDISDTGTTLTFDLVKKSYATGALLDCDWYINDKEYLMFKYTVKLTDVKAAQIATELQKQCADPENVDLVSELFQNKAQVTADKDVLIDGKPGRTITDTADLTLKQVIKKTAPGLTKAASDVKATRKSNPGINIPTWIITVSNEKTNDADAPMTNIVLEDELSGGMQYAAGAKLDSDLSKNFNGYSTDGGETWNDLDDCVTVNGSKFTIKLPNTVQLQPGQSVQIRYAADDPNLAANEEVPEKTYFNKTTLSTSEKIYQDRVTAGDLVDGKLEATASNSKAA